MKVSCLLYRPFSMWSNPVMKALTVYKLKSSFFIHNSSSYTYTAETTSNHNYTHWHWICFIGYTFHSMLTKPWSTDLRPVQGGCAVCPWSYSLHSVPSRVDRAAETGDHLKGAPGHLSRTEPIWWSHTFSLNNRATTWLRKQLERNLEEFIYLTQSAFLT